MQLKPSGHYWKEAQVMRRNSYSLVVAVTLLAGLSILATGCSRKVTAPPAAPAPKAEAPSPAPVTPPVPAIQLSASPSAIERGQSTIISWSSSNATGVTLDNGIGSVETSGNRRVSPTASTTYVARATGPGGNAVAETRVTVAMPPTVAPSPAPAITDIEFFNANVKDIFFEYDKYEIREDARLILQENARALIQRGNIKLTIEGHCDERGSEKYNLALGDMRANSVRDFLIGQGISSDRIDTISYGNERPFCQEHSESCWQMNRRAHFVIR
jgi:peptidoglycan-associated lipoprotein